MNWFDILKNLPTPYAYSDVSFETIEDIKEAQRKRREYYERYGVIPDIFFGRLKVLSKLGISMKQFLKSDVILSSNPSRIINLIEFYEKGWPKLIVSVTFDRQEVYMGKRDNWIKASGPKIILKDYSTEGSFDIRPDDFLYLLKNPQPSVVVEIKLKMGLRFLEELMNEKGRESLQNLVIGATTSHNRKSTLYLLEKLWDEGYLRENEYISKAARIPRKKGQPAGSKKHSDLYTDENPKGTIHGLKFATVKDAKRSVNKIKRSGKTHAHKIQAAVAMEQRAREMGKKSAALVYRKYINSMKRKTKQRADGK